MSKQESSLVSCLLDKLLDDEPDKTLEPIKSPYQQLSTFYNSIRRDLEYLLNTRASGLVWPDAYRHLHQSLLSYGIPDFMSESMLSKYQQDKFCDKLAVCIATFEPRLKNVMVNLIGDQESGDRIIKIRIEGILMLEPEPEQIVFDSVLNPGTNQISITGLVE